MTQKMGQSLMKIFLKISLENIVMKRGVTRDDIFSSSI